MTFQEAQIIALAIKAKALETEVIAMQCHDRGARISGTGEYTEESYLDCANGLHSLHNEIQNLARSSGALG